MIVLEIRGQDSTQRGFMLLETPLRWSRLCAALSGPLHPSRGHLQPSPGFLYRWPNDDAQTGKGYTRASLSAVFWLRKRGGASPLRLNRLARIFGKRLFQRKYGKRKNSESPHKHWGFMVAWVDLNHRPRPYQGSVFRFYKNLPVPRGLPNTAQVIQGYSNLWVQLWVEDFGLRWSARRLRTDEKDDDITHPAWYQNSKKPVILAYFSNSPRTGARPQSMRRTE